jgi:hypothetical protein
MFTIDAQLKALEETALLHIQSVDLFTPMKQLDVVLQALIDIPTAERRADTDFTRQAAVALDMLSAHARQLCACVRTLSEHVHGPAPMKT